MPSARAPGPPASARRRLPRGPPARGRSAVQGFRTAPLPQEDKHGSSGNWQVKEGNADEFVERWREFRTWTKEENQGFLGARLIRNLAVPNSFVSFAAWQDLDSMRAWQGSPEFAKRFGECRVLCDDTQSGGCEVAATV